MGDFDPIEVDERPRADGHVRRRALVIGIDAYRDTTLRTVMTSDGAADLAALLKTRGYEVTLLRDEKATLAAVKRALAAIVDASDEDDVVLCYFGGHGVLLKHRPVLLLADARRRGTGFDGGVLPMAQLLAALRRGPRWTVILLDACHMGLALDPSCSRSAVETKERAGGFALLSGSTSDDVTQDTYSDERAGGAFTKALFEGLSGSAADPDGGVRFSSLARHVQAWLEVWKQTPEARLIAARQTPVLRLEVADVQILPAHRYRDLAPPPAAKIACAAFSPDGRRLITGGEDRMVRIWDPLTGTQVHAPIVHAGDVQGVAFVGDNTVTSVSLDGVTKVWELTSGRVVEIPRIRLRGKVTGVATDGLFRAITTTEGLYQADLTGTFKPAGTRRLSREPTHFWSVAYTRGLFDVITGDQDGNVMLWDALVGVPSIEGTHEGPVWVVATGPDPRYVAAGGTDRHPGPTLRNQPRIWDLETGKAMLLPGHRSAVTGMAFDRDGKRVATACYDGVVRVFDAHRGELLHQLTVAVNGRHHRPEAYAVCFSPDGATLFAGYSDGRGRLFAL